MNEGICIGGSMNGKRVSCQGELYRAPGVYEVAEIPDFNVTMDATVSYSIDEYFWTRHDSQIGRVWFWRHSSIETKDQLLKVLMETF